MNINYMKILLLSIIAALLSCSDGSSAPETPGKEGDIKLPKKEMRAVWLATVGNMDWPKDVASIERQKQEYIEYLEIFKQYNINTIIAQVRPMADAFYASDLEPWSEYLTGTQGKDPGYDPLKFMLEEAHKRDIEFHAWLNPYRIANNVTTFKPAASHIYNQHPEWTMTYNKLLIFRPALPEVRSFFIDVVRDLITKYDVDGVHFDDYFYPYPSTGIELDDQEDYAKYGAGYASIEDFRRGNVNKIVEDVHNLVKSTRPDVLFSISPYAVWRNKSQDPNGSDTSGLNNYDGLYADIRLWCEKGWIDYVVPQLYASTENVAANFIKLSEWWPKNSFDTPVLIGYGLYKFGNEKEGAIFMNPKELETQFFYAAREEKIVGGVMFNATAFKRNSIDILSTLGKVYSEPVLVPFMGRKTLPEPSPVNNLKVSGNSLQWDAASGKDLRYVVYKVDDGNGKIVTVTTDTSYSPKAGGEYVVTALNRDNLESAVSQVVNYKK